MFLCLWCLSVGCVKLRKLSEQSEQNKQLFSREKARLYIIYIYLSNYFTWYIERALVSRFRLFGLFGLFGLLVQRSMPYCWQIHATAFGGNNCWRGFAPRADKWGRLALNQRWKVRALTPAAAANSYLYADFMLQYLFWPLTIEHWTFSVVCCLLSVVRCPLSLQSYEISATYASEMTANYVRWITDKDGQRRTATRGSVVPLQWVWKSAHGVARNTTGWSAQFDTSRSPKTLLEKS